MTSTKELTDYARFLRNAAPREFDAFRSAFANYTKATITDMVAATGDLSLVQGRAQQCVKIMQLLEEIK